jgi:hypothetical protein
MHKRQGIELEVRRLHHELQVVIILVELVPGEEVLEDFTIPRKRVDG